MSIDIETGAIVEGPPAASVGTSGPTTLASGQGHLIATETEILLLDDQFESLAASPVALATAGSTPCSTAPARASTLRTRVLRAP